MWMSRMIQAVLLKRDFFTLYVQFATSLQRYGVRFPNQSSTVLERGKVTSLLKYGVEHPFQSKQVQQTAAGTNMKKYGVANVFASKSVQDRIKTTNLERRGVANPSQDPFVEKKRTDTMFRKYGVKYTMQHPMYYRISRKNALKVQPIEVDGKLFTVHSKEEGKVLVELVASGFRASELETDPSRMPPILYTNPETDKTSRYFPDIFVPRLNWLIEVKCNYTFTNNKELNLAKRKACKDLGFRYNFIIR
jgi:hypothetical protein